MPNYKVKLKYKRALKTMEPGTEVILDTPHGSFTLHNKGRSNCFPNWRY